MKLLKTTNLLNDENKTKIIGLLTILIIVLWLVLYFIPEIFVSLFNTVLGNLILLIIVILIFSKDKTYGIITGTIIIILYRFSRLSKEQFTNASENKFLKIQNTINRQKVFDMGIISEQTSQEELDYFNNHGMWPWSDEVINIYEDLQRQNPYVRSSIKDSTNYSRTVYNQAAILQALSYQTKEGQMLLNGVLVKNPKSIEKLPSGFGNFGYNSDLVEDYTNDIIKCNLVKNGDNPSLERITYTGKGGIFNQQTKKIENVDYNDLENIIPGFKFINGPCNPCEAVGANPNYSCPFSLNTKNNGPLISNVWNYLWNK